MDRSHPPVPGPSKSELGLHLRTLRLALGLTIAQLAERSGISAAIVEAIEVGGDEIERKVLGKIATGLGMTTGTIIRLWERRVTITAPDFET
ncbi:helix-turn-helix protein [Enhygromyxa salina]|uniref:Helix-turn-helix protein n=1 Tax=Enhygromyxa salina TaxID=215803 RepID=A0A2S9XB33_9BACT|nr:helix-turn-helix transcriptional regulator [Enhygromyxa salina]PRP89911.1 helix-turn-helix protein [Enhygromyxa salina]